MPDRADKVADAVNEALESLVQKFALDVHGELVDHTPVDTGWARSNWIPSIGAPLESPIGTPQSIDTGASAVGVAQITTWKLVDRQIYLANNVPYIRRLNAGHSKKEPAGFIERAIQVAMTNMGKTEL